MPYRALKGDGAAATSLLHHCVATRSSQKRAYAGQGDEAGRPGFKMARQLFRKGDWLVLGAAASLVAWLFIVAWHHPAAADVTIRAGGRVFLQTTLAHDQLINVPGPLGISVVEVANHRVRVARDPSPRQYCVRQGWLSQEGESAICLPNQTSIELGGAKALYDSLAY